MYSLKSRNNFFRDDQGAVAIITALVLFFVLIGVAALAVDIGKSTTTKNELQNAVDAAALAGARELGVQKDIGDADLTEIIDAVKDSAKEAAFENYADNNRILLVDADIEIGRWDESGFSSLGEGDQPNAVRVIRLGYEFTNFFARIFNIGTSSVGAEAIAITGPSAGPAGETRDLIPFALTQTVANELQEQVDEGGEDLDRDIYFMFSPGDMLELAAGNWGTVNFDGPGAANDKLTAWTRYGYNGSISYDDIIYTAPSAHVNSGPMLDALDHRIREGEKLLVPIIDFVGEAALGSDEVIVKGFAAVTINGREGRGANLVVEIQFHNIVHPGDIAPGGPDDNIDFGVRTVALVK